MASFERLGVMPELIKAITEDMDWLLPKDVQDEAIPLILGGGDVMIAAETGSGKTGAFALPVLQLIYESLRGEADISAVIEEKNAVSSSSSSSASSAVFRLSDTDRDKFVAVDGEGLLCQTREKRLWGGVRSNYGFSKGKWYFEATVADDGLCRVGFATPTSTRNLGTDPQSFGYGGTAKKSFNRKFDDYGEVYQNGDTIGCFLDRGSNTISYSKNGKNLGLAFSIPHKLKNTPLFPAAVLKNAEMRFNFGDAPFQHPPSLDNTTYRACTSASASERESSGGSGSGSNNDNEGAGKSKSHNNNQSPLCIILEPTRELAAQVYDEINKFKKHLDQPEVRVELFIGRCMCRLACVYTVRHSLYLVVCIFMQIDR